MASGGPANPEQVAVRVKSLINNQLKQVLKKEGLPVSGAKATLQTRIIDRESESWCIVFHLWLAEDKKPSILCMCYPPCYNSFRQPQNELTVAFAVQN